MKSPRKTANIAVLAAVLLTSSTRSSHACLWDRDTLVDEQRGLPEITAIIVGRYERHTPEYYERRIRLVSADLKTAKPESAKLLLDDIAVAHDRLKNYDAAIATARQKIARFGVDYRVSSNLGTFYLHKKDLKQAEIWIDRALKINPNAHFGREWVQLKAIKYFQSKGKKPFWSERVEKQADSMMLNTSSAAEPNSAQFNEDRFNDLGLRLNALEGIKGLIKIGDRDNPEYFIALGNLLRVRQDSKLAIFAQWRALEIADAKNVQHPDWIAKSLAMFDEIGMGAITKLQQTDPSLPFDHSNKFKSGSEGQADLKRAYLSQRAYAEKWRASFQAREREIIRGGQNPEDIALFAGFYREWGKPQNYAKGQDDTTPNLWLGLWPIAVVALFCAGLLWRMRVRDFNRRAQMA